MSNNMQKVVCLIKHLIITNLLNFDNLCRNIKIDNA